MRAWARAERCAPTRRRCVPRALVHDSAMADTSYPDTRLLIDNQWRDAAGGKTLDVLNPATGERIGRVAHASIADLDLALDAARRGFEAWRWVPTHERAQTMR